MKKKKFELETMDKQYIGYDGGMAWNGWAVPFFTKETVEQILNDLKEPSAKRGLAENDEEFFDWKYDEELDSFIVIDNATDTNGAEVFHYDCLTEDGEQKLYSFDGYIWVESEE